MTVVIDSTFDPVPSLSRDVSVTVADAASEAAACSVFVSTEDQGPLGGAHNAATAALDRDTLAAAGFTAQTGQTLVLPGTPLTVLVGTGTGLHTAAQLRDAVAVFAGTAHRCAQIAVDLGAVIAAGHIDAALAAQAATEGALLARYHYNQLKRSPDTTPLTQLTLIVEPSAERDHETPDANRSEPENSNAHDQAKQGVQRGLLLARTAALARDLGNTPPRHLSAEKFAEVIARLAPQFGLEVQVFHRQQLIELGCGGLLGVNAGSAEEPRMIVLKYTPQRADDTTEHLALVGKGIMYDSGGISLKPSNAMHAAMKLDMMGAAAVFSAMTSLRDLNVQTAVTGWLMCTDNMPSGSATKLGDVLTIRGGTTVEVKNTDAEGRLVLADGLALATEESRRPDAIVDIATLTGAALMALGTRTAALITNHDAVAEQLQAAAAVSDETVWRLPLDHRYREQLKSDVADLANIGGQYAGTILAALFLNEFVDGIPWGHLDVAGTMQAENNDLWRTVGATGFGARLLAEFAAAFQAPQSDDATPGREQVGR